MAWNLGGGFQPGDPRYSPSGKTYDSRQANGENLRRKEIDDHYAAVTAKGNAAMQSGRGYDLDAVLASKDRQPGSDPNLYKQFYDDTLGFLGAHPLNRAPVETGRVGQVPGAPITYSPEIMAQIDRAKQMVQAGSEKNIFTQHKSTGLMAFAEKAAIPAAYAAMTFGSGGLAATGISGSGGVGMGAGAGAGTVIGGPAAGAGTVIGGTAAAAPVVAAPSSAAATAAGSPFAAPLPAITTSPPAAAPGFMATVGKAVVGAGEFMAANPIPTMLAGQALAGANSPNELDVADQENQQRIDAENRAKAEQAAGNARIAQTGDISTWRYSGAPLKKLKTRIPRTGLMGRR